MIAMSAPANPVPTAAPANSAGPAESQAPAAGSADSAASESTPFAAVLGHQMKAGKQDDGKAEPAAKAVLLLDATEAMPPADALAIIASMLPGVAQADAGKGVAKIDSAKGIEAAIGEEADLAVETGNETDPAQILAAPVIAGTQTSAPTTAGKKGAEPAGDAIALARDPKTPATSAAIVAAEAMAKKAETATEVGAKPDAGKFDALLDAAMQTQSSGANAASQAASSNAAQGTQANSSAQTLPVATPVGARGWDNEVGEKLTWMAGRKETHAELVLNPPQLGRVEVSLSISGDQANATFVSASPLVREALENAIPHLRETLQSAGISLGQTQVGAESFQQAANQRENGDNSARGGNPGNSADVGGDAASSQTSPAQWLRRGNGLVDTFA